MSRPIPAMTTLSRRHLLGLGAAVGAASLLPASFRTAMALPPAPGGLKGVEHVVILMQENRSFDHYYGTLQGVCGSADKTVAPTRDGGTVFAQPTSGGGHQLPFLVREARDAGANDIEYIASLPHSWADGGRAWNNGWEDNWIAAKGAATMAAYDRRDLPFQFELADNFTICDHYFCSITAGTSPNRNHLISGKTGYEPGGVRRAVDNAAYAETHAGYDWPTYQQELQRAGVSWQILQEWDNFTDSNEEYFQPYKELTRRVLSRVPGVWTNMESFYGAVLRADENRRRTLLDQLEAALAQVSPADRELFDRALRRRPAGTLAAAFADQVARDALPRVTHLVANSEDCEHPAGSSPIEGSQLVHDLLQAFGDNPAVWRKTVFILTFDEFDGYFDHLLHPVPPRSVSEEWWDGLPTGLGPRVPMLVVSPWTVGGRVNSQVFDHTSVIRLLETWTGVACTQISDWRRSVTGDLAGVLDLGGTPTPSLPALTRPGPVPPFTSRWKPTPPQQQQLPRQEAGVRPADALPYRLDASYDPGSDRLQLTNTGKAAANVAVLDLSGGGDPLHRVVSGQLTLPLGQTRTGGTTARAGAVREIVVLGPNRFRRDFRTDGTLLVTASSDHGAGLLRVEIGNTGDTPLTVELTDAATGPATGTGAVTRIQLGARASITRTIDTCAMHGWYDLIVRAGENRFWITGHLENGAPSITSPFTPDGRHDVPAARCTPTPSPSATPSPSPGPTTAGPGTPTPTAAPTGTAVPPAPAVKESVGGLANTGRHR
ncbi:alkaline phosphatase family protein [Enemella evansiae]|uniref:alkaline phosphatase family protein n=1 Tax=Enemella evansiae TaxID=2016499 RepID=UPI0010F13911|nr:alkaline phosphatase family protein [Enemella evansiae]TDO92427.1 phospholipase C [Enemella evansiae]